MRYPGPFWFQAFVAGELIWQFPFFFVATHILMRYPLPSHQGEDDKNAEYPPWFRTACLIYGSHVTTTLMPILVTFATSTEMTTTQIAMTMSVYSPYWMFPLALVYLAAREDFVTLHDNKQPPHGTKQE